MARRGKTGGDGGPWVELDKPKPPRVADHYRYWSDEPPEVSARCRYWLAQIDKGWRPNKYVSRHCYDCSAEWYGTYIWEYLHLIRPAVQRSREALHRG